MKILLINNGKGWSGGREHFKEQRYSIEVTGRSYPNFCCGWLETRAL